MIQDEDELLVKVVVIGNPGVGKTSLRRSFIGESFEANYLQTIGSDFSYTSLMVQNKKLGLAIWDLAGQPEFRSVHDLFYKGAVGVIAVFDIVDQKSFDDIRNWIQNFINSTGQNDIPLLIIGNKIDLEKTSSNYITAENQLAFTKELISTENYNFQVSSIRSSAKTGENVYSGILEFSSLILDWIKNKQQDKTFQKIIPDDRFRNFPIAYIFCMNQVQGPIVIATSAAPDLELGDEKVSAVKLISSFDYEDIISNLSVTGTYTWQKPLGIFYYITFIVENLKARGGNELYVIGINADKELTNVLAGLKGLIDGFLHKAMNDFRKFTLEQNINFVINAYSPVEGSSITKGII